MSTEQRKARVTSKDVARLAGVTQPTVSRALRDDPRVTEETKQRVRDAASSLGYVANVLGRSLSTRQTRQVAMVADLNNPLYPSLVAPIHDELAGLGYGMVLLAERGDEVDVYERLLDRSVDGAVLTTTRLRGSLAHELRNREVPFVFLNRVSDRTPGDAVVSANAEGAAQVAALFVSQGHRRVGAVLGVPETSTSRDREQGFRKVLADAGIELPRRWVHRGWFTHHHGVEGFEAIMSGRDRPTAIFCVNDATAIGVLNAAMLAGVKVPDDLAVVGFDDIEMASWPAFELTTVRSPLAAMARRAVQLLVGRLQGHAPEQPRVEEMPVSLLLRRTHG